jgi:hypothetical protein
VVASRLVDGPWRPAAPIRMVVGRCSWMAIVQ